MRCLIALGTDRSPAEDLLAWLEQARAEFPELAVSGPGALHVTLHFLGEIDDAAARMAATALAVAVAVLPAGRWTIRYSGAGVFPLRSRPKVLWLGVDDAGGRLVATHAAVGRALLAGGLTLQDRPYRPHLTLARVRRQPTQRDRIDSILRHLDHAPTPAPSPVRSLILFRSVLSRGAARHEVLTEAPLPGLRRD